MTESERPSAVTIYDVARLAGVSPSAVSRALGKPGRLNVDTERRIREAAERLNFRINPIARALPTGRTRALGMVIPDITNPAFFEAVRGVERAAAERDYTLLLTESAESSEREGRGIERMLPSVDGVILGTTRLPNARVREFAGQKPLVLVSSALRGIPSVVPDIDVGVAEVVDHLRELGHRHLLWVAGPGGSWVSRRRESSLRSHAEAAGMTVTSIPSAAPTLLAGRALAPAAVGSGATAVVAFNDLLAIGILQAATEAGTRIPGQLSVIGFDDIFGADFTTPPLTTVRTALGEAGERAARMLLALLEDGAPATPPSTSAIPTRLIVRGSTARVPS